MHTPDARWIRGFVLPPVVLLLLSTAGNAHAGADVSVHLGDDPDPATVGQPLTLQVIVANGGPDIAASVTLGVGLPAAVTFVSVTPNPPFGSCASFSDPGGQFVVCTFPTLPISTTPVDIVVLPQQPGTLDFEASASGPTPDPDFANNIAQESTEVGAADEEEADLAVTKSALERFVPVGEQVTYFIDVENQGPDPATNVVLEDDLPPGVEVLEVRPDQGSCPVTGPERVECTLGTIGVGQKVTVRVTVRTGEKGILVNNASAAGDQPDPDPTDNVDGERVQSGPIVRKRDLLEIDADGSGTVTPGDTLRYVVEIDAVGTEVDDASFDDVLPGTLVEGSTTVDRVSGTVAIFERPDLVSVEFGRIEDEVIVVELLMIVGPTVPASGAIANQGAINGRFEFTEGTIPSDDPDTSEPGDETETEVEDPTAPTPSPTPVPTASPTPSPTPTQSPGPTPVAVVAIDIHPIQVVQDPPGKEVEETIELVAQKDTMVRVFVSIDALIDTTIGPVVGTLRVDGREQSIEANLLVSNPPTPGDLITRVIPIGDLVFAGGQGFLEQLAFNFFTGAGSITPGAGIHDMDFTLELPGGQVIEATESFEFKTSFDGVQYDVLYAFVEISSFTQSFLFLEPAPDAYRNDLARFFERLIAVFPLPRSRSEWSYDSTKYQISNWSTFALWLIAASIDSRTHNDRLVLMVPGREGNRPQGLLQEEEGAEGYAPYLISETVFLQVRSSDFNLAHELGHTYRLGTPTLNLGSGHNDENSDAGWDVLEVTGRGLRLKPEMGGGFMRALMFPTANQDSDGWITYQEYNELLDQFLANRAALGAARVTASDPGSRADGVAREDPRVEGVAATDDVLVVSGTIFAAGGHVLFPFFQSTGNPSARGQADGIYSVAILAPGGVEISRAEFSPSFAELADPGDVAAPFLLRMAFRDDAERIELRERGRLLETRVVSPRAPTVAIVTLEETGSFVEGEIDASDPDGDPVEVVVSYTPDGDRFVDAHVEWIEAGRRFRFDRSRLPGSAAGRIRVLATDGVHSTSVLSEPFAVANQPPFARIESPLDASVVGPGQALALRGGGNDLEDGTLRDASLRWTSDLAGALGDGARLDVPGSSLGVGEHVITLTATDAAGASGSAAVTVVVVQNPTPDAVVEEVRVVPPGLAPGSPARIEAAIASYGSPASGVVSFYEGDPDLGGTLLDSAALFLPANGRTIARTAWVPAAMGPATLFARITSVASLGPLVLPETDTGDNQASTTILVGAPGFLQATPGSLDFGAELAVLNLFLENGGDGAVAWSIETSDDDQDAVRLSVQGGPPSTRIEDGLLPGGGLAVVTVLVDRPGFDADEHTVLLSLSSTAGDRISIPVSYRDGAGAPGLDHFVLYRVKTTRKTPRFRRFGPVRLANDLDIADYDVMRPLALAVPADEDGAGVEDPDVHLEEYRLKATHGTPSFDQLADVRVVNQCGDLLVEVKRPVSLLVPSAKGLDAPVEAPDPATHGLDHFLCYLARVQGRAADGTELPPFPRGIQVELSDQFQTRRYDLPEITKLCVPTAKSGSPVVLAGPDRGSPKPIEPAGILRSEEALLCYRARLSIRRIQQDGCGPLEQHDRGEHIQPRQEEHTERTGIFVTNQFGEQRLDTRRQVEVCIPTRRPPAEP